MTRSAYDSQPLGPGVENISQTAALLANVFGRPELFTPEFIDWEYNQNPDGRAVGCNAFAESDGSLAAHYVTQPLRARLAGQEAHGLLSLNTATHADHRGQGLFTRLAEETYELGRQEGYEFVIGVANQYSTRGFIEKLGFQLVGPLMAKIGVGGVGTHLVDDDLQYMRLWSKENLAWRVRNPSHQYVLAPRGDRTEILARSGKAGIRVVLGSFPAELLEPTARSRSSPLRLWIGLDSRVSGRRNLYYEIPQRLRPSPLNLIYKDLTGRGTEIDPAKIKFSALDFDAY